MTGIVFNAGSIRSRPRKIEVGFHSHERFVVQRSRVSGNPLHTRCTALENDWLMASVLSSLQSNAASLSTYRAHLVA